MPRNGNIVPAESRGLIKGAQYSLQAPRYTFAMAEDERELGFYRAIEDLFAALRGVPHVLSPKDFQLMRQWWREEVPLAAVRTGVTEVFARRRERGGDEPVVSLSYCRHAVRRHARRLAEMQVGAPRDQLPEKPADTADALRSLSEKLKRAADHVRSAEPAAAAVLERMVPEVEAAVVLPLRNLEEHLFALESTLLGACLEAIDEKTRNHLEHRARAEAEAAAAAPDARDRAFRALRDRLLRDHLGLPRLELAP